MRKDEGFVPVRNADEKLKNAAAEWIAYVEPELKEVTLIRYETLLRKYVLPIYGDTPVDALKDSELSSYAVRMGENELSEKTVSSIVTMVRRIRTFWLEGNESGPYAAAWHYDNGAPKLKFLSDDEYERLIRHLRATATPDAIGIWLCMETGIKLGELCALDGRDVSEGRVTLHRSLQRVQNRNAAEGEKKTHIVFSEYKKTSSMYRTLPLSSELSEAISGIAETGRYLLTGENDRFADTRTMENRLRAVAAACRIEGVCFNLLRDTYALRAISAGCDIRSLSKNLGHSGLTVTERRYGRYYEKLDEYGERIPL